MKTGYLQAMRDIEKHNAQLAGVLPKTYNLFTSNAVDKRADWFSR